MDGFHCGGKIRSPINFNAGLEPGEVETGFIFSRTICARSRDSRIWVKIFGIEKRCFSLGALAVFWGGIHYILKSCLLEITLFQNAYVGLVFQALQKLRSLTLCFHMNLWTADSAFNKKLERVLLAVS